MQASFTKQDLIDLILDHASAFHNAKRLTWYLTEADK